MSDSKEATPVLSPEDLRALVLEYVDALFKARHLTDRLDELFRQLNPDNQIMTLTPAFVEHVSSKLLKVLIGPIKADWVEWWCYETKAFDQWLADAGLGPVPLNIGSLGDETGFGEVLSFDEFYAFAFLQQPYAELVQSRPTS